MTFEIAVLDTAETQEAINARKWAGASVVAPIVEALKPFVGTQSGIFVAGMTDNHVNALRTTMKRKGIVISVYRAERDGVKGHVVTARADR